MFRFTTALLFVCLPLFAQIAQADQPLHKRIDALILAKAGGKVSERSSDAEFLRRVYLDFAGRIPTAQEARTFLNDKNAKKRTQLIDRMLASKEYPVRMAEAFSIMFMERLGEHKAWESYLQKCFAENKPWDTMTREMLAGKSDDKETAGAVFFLSKRLENYGQNPVDYPGLASDIGRLFMGKDFACAQCHDHIFIKDYKQRDMQGLLAFVQNVSVRRGDMPAVQEKPTTKKVEFSSVFEGEANFTGPRVPGVKEIDIPKFKRGEEYLVKPDRKKRTPGVLKFSPLEKLAEILPTPENKDFNRNIANRLWFLMMGRGIIHPLDLAHSDNPPSHPELLDLLAREMVAHKYDIKWMIRELALTETYQRSSQLPKGEKKVEAKKFRTAIQRRLSPEQLLRTMLIATGEKDAKGGATFDKSRSLFLKAFANPPREPEEEFSPTLKAALFVLNDGTVQSWLQSKPGNLQDRLAKIKDGKQLVEELYLSVLTRLPSEREAKIVSDYLARRKDNRTEALRNLTWALVATTEFCVNH